MILLFFLLFILCRSCPSENFQCVILQTNLTNYIISAYSPIPPVTREEPEKIKIWRQQQEVRLEEKGKP